MKTIFRCIYLWIAFIFTDVGIVVLAHNWGWITFFWTLVASIFFIININELIKEIQRTPFEGKGKPEALKYDLAGLWSRRIDKEHRLVYQVKDNELIIISCRYHYD